MNTASVIFLFLAAACSSGPNTQKIKSNTDPRVEAVRRYLDEHRLSDPERQLNVYFFSQTSCIPCTRDKFSKSLALFRNTRTRTVLFLDDAFPADSVTNPNVLVVHENRDTLERKGLAFPSPCVFIFIKDEFQVLDINLSFLDGIDSLKEKYKL